jgi:chromosome segregation ATPase
MHYLNKQKEKLRLTQTGGFFDPDTTSQKTYSEFCEKRITQEELKIMQMEREVENLKTNQRDLSKIEKEVKQKEEKIKKLTLKNMKEEKDQKLIREKTLQELACLKTKVSTSKKRLQELEVCYEANLVEFEQLSRMCDMKEKEYNESHKILEKMNFEIKGINEESNNAGKCQLRLQEEKKMIFEKIHFLDKELDAKLQEFRMMKENSKKEEDELIRLEEEKENVEKEGKIIEDGIEEFQRKIEEFEKIIEEKRLGLTKIIGEVKKVELNNFSISKNLEIKTKNLNKQKQKLEDMNNINEKIVLKISDYEKENEKKQNELNDLKKEIERKDKQLENQKNEKNNLDKKMKEMKKLIEYTFFELDKFVDLDEKLKNKIKEGYYNHITKMNELKKAQTFYCQNSSNDEIYYRTK